MTASRELINPLATTGIIPQWMFLTQDNKITFCSLQFIFFAVIFAPYHLLCFYIFSDSTESEDKETRVFPWSMKRARKQGVKKRWWYFEINTSEEKQHLTNRAKINKAYCFFGDVPQRHTGLLMNSLGFTILVTNPFSSVAEFPLEWCCNREWYKSFKTVKCMLICKYTKFSKTEKIH